MSAISFEFVLTQAEQLPPNARVQLIAALAQGLAQSALSKPQTQAERKAAIDAVCGKYADVNTSVDEFLARKHEDTEREEARYLARHPEEGS